MDLWLQHRCTLCQPYPKLVVLVLERGYFQTCQSHLASLTAFLKDKRVKDYHLLALLSIFCVSYQVSNKNYIGVVTRERLLVDPINQLFIFCIEHGEIEEFVCLEVITFSLI